jgi:predicted amidophosphoribosyltransferase
MSYICLYCNYIGEEKVCPKCGMLMEEQCPNCKLPKTDCICNLEDVLESEEKEEAEQE